MRVGVSVKATPEAKPAQTTREESESDNDLDIGDDDNELLSKLGAPVKESRELSKEPTRVDVSLEVKVTPKGVFPAKALVEIACGEEGDPELWMPGEVIDVIAHPDKVCLIRARL